RPPFSFPRKKTGVARPKERRLDWQSQSRMTFMPPEWKCLRAAKPRLALLYDLAYFYYPLPLCPSCRSTQ
ncbi:hypothetical protein AAAV73_01655, partial [Hominicoprocola fusiformis]